MNYKRSRDLAWQILIKHEIKELPVDVKKICSAEKINVFTYNEGKEFIKSLNLEDNIKDNDAFSIGSLIFYDSDKPEPRIRFSIAHELGHIFLHLDNNFSTSRPTVYNREISPCDNPIETEANIFASRLLAPLSVLQFLNLNSASEIAEVCGISYTAAKYRYSRLCEIRHRNSVRRREKNHGTFLLSKYERKVVENFREFIEKNKREDRTETEEEKSYPL